MSLIYDDDDDDIITIYYLHITNSIQTKFAEMLEGVEYSTPEKLCEFVDALYKCSRKNPVGCARKVADAIYEHHLEFQVKMEKSKNGTAPLPKDFEMVSRHRADGMDGWVVEWVGGECTGGFTG